MRKLYVIFLTILWSTILLGNWIDLDNDVETGFKVINQGSDYLDVEFFLKGYENEKITVENGEFDKISYPNSGEFLRVGKPDLPRFSTLIAIPDKGQVDVEIIDEKSIVLEQIKIYPRQPLQNESKRIDYEFTLDREYYESSDVFPQQVVQISNPAVIRGLRVATLTINPFQYYPSENKLKVYSKSKIRINFKQQRGENEISRSRKLSPAFSNFYDSTILNYSSENNRDNLQEPSYLFVYTDESVMPYLGELISWKKQKGFEVDAVSLQETGSSLNQVKDYIQNAYDNWQNPPEFVCLVGDAAGNYDVPTGHFSTGQYDGEGDHFYTLLDGDDYLSDIFIGRLSFNSLTELATIIAKILNYEKNPYMGNTEWYDSILLVGDPTDSGPSCVDTKLYVGQKMMQYNENYNLTEVYQGNWVQNIAAAINDGVSYFNYRGFANMSGWSVANISALNNGYMLPVAVAITCLTGNFESTNDCISERFLKAGSPTTPKGAIAAISTATGNTHTCFNNCMDAGIFEGIFSNNIFHMGGALNKGKLNLHLNYPENPNSYVEKFSYWNNLMGDPGLDLWTTAPESLSVSYDDNIETGTNYLDVLVGNEAGEPLEGAWVTARTDNDEIFATNYTDITGVARLFVDSDYNGSVHLTVTKHDFIPHLGEFSIEEPPLFLSVEDFQLIEISGNNDGLINAGELIGVQISLQNHGNQTAENVTVELSTEMEGVSIEQGSLSFDDIEGNNSGSAIQNAEISLSTFLSEGAEIILQATISCDGYQWDDYIYFDINGVFLQLESYQIIDGDNNQLDPGEEVLLQLTLTNIGSNDCNNLSAVLLFDYPDLDITDNLIDINPISAGQTVIISDMFSLEANLLMVPGNQIPVNLSFSGSDGYEQMIQFLLETGEVEQHYPLGPDNYGHYFYDDSDLIYINAQSYNWIEIDPDNGGPGSELEIADIGNMGFNYYQELPFPVTFYGITYDSLTICSNGWISPGITNNQSFMNWMIPGAPGPSPIIAVFWDDLVMGDIDGGGNYISNGSSICYYYDESEGYLVIQWSGLLNEYDDSEEIFQCLIYDNSLYPTGNGDNMIKMQYQDVNNTDQGSYDSFLVSHGMYATVGIENHLSDDGIQYTYNNVYPAAAKPLTSGTAITISGAPINSEEPYLVVNELNPVDEDGDGFLENGEAVDLFINITNLGGNIATGVSATIESDSPYLIINTGQVDYEDIYGSGSSENISPFEIEIAEDCPDLFNATFMFSITCDQGNWQIPQHLNLSGPDIAIVSMEIIDTNNSMLDPGENAILQINMINNGSAPALDMVVQIDSDNEGVLPDEAIIPLGLLDPGETMSITLPIIAESDCEITEIYNIESQISNNQGYEFILYYDMFITQQPVYFEEHFSEFPPPGWIIDGENWYLQNTSNAGGSSPEMLFWGSAGFNGTQQIITPVINTLGNNELRIQFKHTMNGEPGEFSWGIKVSSDLEYWNNAAVFDGDVLYLQEEDFIINAPQIGNDSLYIALYITGNTTTVNYWFIDDFVIEYVPLDPPAFIMGNVTIDDNNMEDVIISAGDYETYPNSDGSYLLNVVPGTYDVKAFKTGYIADIEQDVVIEDVWSETFMDFNLEPLSNDYAPENVMAVSDIYQVILEWDIPGSNGYNERSQEIDISSHKDFDRDLRILNSYQIYRNDELLVNIDDPNQNSYIDTPLPNGLYDYYLLAVYDDGISPASNIAPVEIDLPVPQNLNVTATPIGGNVIINWQAPNTEVSSYRLYCDGQLIVDQVATYHIDHNVSSGSYIYGVSAVYEGVESDVVEQAVDITDTEDLIPMITHDYGNYPNPFNPKTTIRFDLSRTANVDLNIYNTRGKLVKKLLHSNLSPASYQISWEGNDQFDQPVASGVYFYRISLDGKSFSSRKMILMK